MNEYLNLGLVQSVQTVLEEGTFRRAAERLHITPSALTQQVKRLEESVGFTLLSREHHPIKLTERGERFMLHARESLAASRRAMEEAEGRQLRVGFISGYPRSHDEPFLVTFRQNHPDITLSFLQLGWGEQVSRLLAGDVDAVLARPPVEERGEIEAVTVFREPRVVAVQERSLLAERHTLTLADLDGVPVIGARGASHEWTKYWVIDPRPSGEPVEYGARAETMEEALALVSSGRNIMITADSVSKRYQYPGVRYLPLSDGPDCSVELCTRADDFRMAVRGLRAATAPNTPRRAVAPGFGTAPERGLEREP